MSDLGKKPNVVKESITPPIAKNNIDKVNKTEKSQGSNKKLDTFSSNKYAKGESLENKGLLKGLIQITQLTKKINQGLFQKLVFLEEVPK